MNHESTISSVPPRLELRDISKTFPGVKALSSVNMDVMPGEVHAICGENGAGKSTLMKVLTGNYEPDRGRILLNAKEVQIRDQKHAQDLGIAIVYQDRSLVGKLQVADNIFPGKKPTNRLGLIDRRELNKKASALLASLRLDSIDPDERLENLSVAHQQMVEVCKALAQDPDILILDEPTASLTDREVDTLFGIVRKLRERGVSIIYISHRMAEVFAIADRVTVLKDGVAQGTFSVGDMTMNGLIRLMVGRELFAHAYESYASDPVVMEVKNFSGAGFYNVSFRVKKGEVIGLAGLAGAGRTELARAIFGAEPAEEGKILLRGVEVKIRHPSDAIKYRIGYLPEDRKEQGLFMGMSIAHNMLSARLAIGSGVWIDESAITTVSERYRSQLRIKSQDTREKVINLSGGNQQKVVLAKWLSLQPELFIVDEPTHGVDVGAKAEIYDIIKSLAAKGVAVILISSELPEILALSDRVIVMSNQTVVGELDRAEATEEVILQYASGIRNM